MSNIVKKESTAVVEGVTEEAIKDFLFGSNTKLSDAQMVLFINTAIKYNLDPFKREIYAIVYGNKLSIITGFEVYLKRADRSGKLDGWKAWTEKEGSELKACIEIKRKDWSDPFYHEVYFSEYKQNSPIWNSKPLTMIKKVAMAQGFRLAFPDDLGGMPYTADELPPEMGTPVDPETAKAKREMQEKQKAIDVEAEKANIKESYSKNEQENNRRKPTDSEMRELEEKVLKALETPERVSMWMNGATKGKYSNVKEITTLKQLTFLNGRIDEYIKDGEND